jgi:hypothetical protein
VLATLCPSKEPDQLRSVKPAPPGSKIGNKVVFSPPKAVAGMPKRIGRVKEEVWSDVYQSEWGWYAYTSQLIEWSDASRSIRLTYYYYPEGGKGWRFGGQTFLEDRPEIINALIRETLEMNQTNCAHPNPIRLWSFDTPAISTPSPRSSPRSTPL